MPPRRKPPWWHANSGWLVALLIALAGGWLNDKVRAAGNDRILDSMPARWDRESDLLSHCFERQLDLIRQCGHCQ